MAGMLPFESSSVLVLDSADPHHSVEATAKGFIAYSSLESYLFTALPEGYIVAFALVTDKLKLKYRGESGVVPS
jgi:hypothetical protein